MKEKNSISKSQEYDSLRSELLQNKQYVFERPLLIITGFGIAATQLSDTTAINLLPLLLIIISLINLWFTVNRMKSIARIVAYIQVFLEPNSNYEWIGWENALRVHRNWSKTTSNKQKEEEIDEIVDYDAIPDAMMFFRPLYFLHLLMVLLALVASLFSIFLNPDIFHISISGITLFVSLIFFYFIIGPYRPNNMKELIEVQRAIWILSFTKKKISKKKNNKE